MKSHAMRAFTRRFLRDAGGVSAIEFAILGPVVFILVLATVEIALDMFVDASVQMAAQTASRVGLTTTVPANTTRDAEAKRIVNAMLQEWTNVGGTVSITAQSYSSYNDIGGTSYQTSMGGFGDVVAYNVSVTMPTFSGIPKLFGIESMTFQRNFIVQNEK
ncbi:TadE/TadG family type IV pilus assembly protein [Caballeronia sp. Lep1P3]|uniref:TadE/TadG family type IV pilus assembly protein n=1 Tax=Caballeronia sp. Lep1P3 TaxID=2878150 RepID=UPI001FD11DA4|nr:TadE/TadG family type IV pilus assembly protein [Caballeronia sp. Lep1P3]